MKTILNKKLIVSRYAKERRFDEPDKSLLARLLTVSCNELNITGIGDLSALHNLVKLYVRDNLVRNLINIETARRLTHLYIINNEITELDTVTKLSNLEKLYAGRNRIQVIEGLKNMENLVELHIENQKLFRGEKMHVEPESLSALQSLQVLNISNNGIDRLDFCASLSSLCVLRCEDNTIEHLAHLTALKECPKLQKVYLSGNPIAKENRYRYHVILNVTKICTLDEKEIHKNEVNFIRNWHQHKQDKLSRTNLQFTQSQKDMNYLSYADVENLANGLPSGFAHLSELIRKRDQPVGIDASYSAPNMATAIKPQPPLQASRSVRDSRLQTPENVASRQGTATPDFQIGGGDVSPAPAKPQSSKPQTKPLMIENTPQSR